VALKALREHSMRTINTGDLTAAGIWLERIVFRRDYDFVRRRR
jgi:hypothetical protein